MNLKETLEAMRGYPYGCAFEAVWDDECPNIPCYKCAEISVDKLLEMLEREYEPKELDSLEKIERDAEKPYVAY